MNGRRIDWIDIGLHVAGALAMVLAGSMAGLLCAGVVAGAVFWPAREWGQADRSRGFIAGGPWSWSLQKHLEAWVPAIAALLAGAALHLLP